MNRREFKKLALCGVLLPDTVSADREPPDPRQKGLDPGWIHLTLGGSGRTISIRKADIAFLHPDILDYNSKCLIRVSGRDVHVQESYGEILRKLNIFS